MRAGIVLFWLVIAVLLITACTLATSTPVASATTTPARTPLQATLLVTDAITPTQLAFSGSTLVWADYRNGTADIYGYDLESRREFPIATSPTSQLQPDVYGPLVVWAESDAIYGYRLDTGRRRRLVDVDRPRRVHIAWPFLAWIEDRKDPGDVLALYTSFSAVVALDLITGHIADLIEDGFITTARLTDRNRLLVYAYGERGIKRQDFAVVAYEPDTNTRIVLGPIGMGMLSGFGVYGRTVAWSVGPHGDMHLVRLGPDGDRQGIFFPERARVRAMVDEDTVVYEPVNRMAQPVGLAAANVRTSARYELMAEGHPLSVMADAGRVVWSTTEGHIRKWLVENRPVPYRCAPQHRLLAYAGGRESPLSRLVPRWSLFPVQPLGRRLARGDNSDRPVGLGCRDAHRTLLGAGCVRRYMVAGWRPCGGAADRCAPSRRQRTGDRRRICRGSTVHHHAGRAHLAGWAFGRPGSRPVLATSGGRRSGLAGIWPAATGVVAGRQVAGLPWVR